MSLIENISVGQTQVATLQNTGENTQSTVVEDFQSTQDVTYDDWSDKIDAANEFLSLHQADENGLFSEEDLLLMDELCVLKDEDGTILSQLIDSDGDGEIDTIEYYNQGEDENATHTVDNGADGTVDSITEFVKDGDETYATEYSVDEDGNKTKTKEYKFDAEGYRFLTYSSEEDEEENEDEDKERKELSAG